jgi:hypothetical protein
MLLAEKRMTGKAIAAKFPDDPARITRIIGDLVAEGFICQTGNYLTIASPAGRE